MDHTLLAIKTERWRILFILLMMSPAVVISQDFDPTVYTRCINGFMSISVRTSHAFRGVVYADKHRKSCVVLGNGPLEHTLNVPLTAIENCGITYDERSEKYFLLVHVREHPVIILQQDRMFNVSCPDVNSTNSTKNISAGGVGVGMGVYVDGSKVHRTLFGEEYNLQITSPSTGSDFMVTKCMGFSGFNYSLELTDYNGCSLNPELISNFAYNSDPVRTATARVHSMFKFPQHNVIHLQCAVVFCHPKCRIVDCNRRRDDPIGGESSGRLVEERFTSTTIRVDEYYNETFAAVKYESSCENHHQLLSALCILFASLFVGALLVNCIFCGLTGYCCCGGRDGDGSDSQGVEYVTTDLKAMDALNSTTVRTPYPSILYPQHITLPPFYHNAQEAHMLTLTHRRPPSTHSSPSPHQLPPSPHHPQHSPASSSSVSQHSDRPLLRSPCPLPPPRHSPSPLSPPRLSPLDPQLMLHRERVMSPYPPPPSQITVEEQRTAV